MKKFAFGLALFALPMVMSAQETITSAAALFFDIINNILIPAVFALAFLFFIWGVFRYVVAGNEESRAEGQRIMLWGVIGLFVMVSVWGLVNLLTGSVNLDTTLDGGDIPVVPQR